MARLKAILVCTLVAAVIGFPQIPNNNQHRSQPNNNDFLNALDSTHVVKIDSFQYQLQNVSYGIPYNTVLSAIEVNRLKLARRLNSCPNDSLRDITLADAGAYLETSFVNSVFHFWYGTHWDFNGYTNVPNQGEVACGYFVSTTLKHAGFNIDRYKLAQQNPLNEAISLGCGSDLIHFHHQEDGQTMDSICSLDQGLYFVGLDNHVGYLLVRQGIAFFIHSNYIGNVGVCMELASQSLAFQNSQWYVLSPISTNPKLIDKWLSGSKVEVKS